jgi:hypothetical protein
VLEIPKSNTFIITRNELRHVLVAFGISDKSAQSVFAAIDKSHRHINVITLASLLEKMGMARNTLSNVLRRIGMDDITINSVFNMVDEQKISAETGRLYNAEIESG